MQAEKHTIISQTLAIKLKPAAEKQLKKGHPWVFDDSITKQSKEGQPGDIAIIFHSKTNKFLAVGLYDPDSPIRIKILSTTNRVRIDQNWFDTSIKTAYEKRKQLLLTDTNAYRLVFGENDKMPSLICDVYDTVVVLKIYSRMWFPYFELIKESLIKVIAPTSIVLRYARKVEQALTSDHPAEGSLLYGQLDNPEIQFREHGVHFIANVIKGHKTGFFLDHRHNRLSVQKMAKEKTVLDVFSYAGGFSVHALCGGASEVTSVDLSQQALNLASQNVALNKIKGKHHTLKGDAFKLLENLISEKKKYDLVIIDPPAFAKAAKEIPTAIKQYERLALLGIKLVASKGTLLLASCSSRVQADTFFDLTKNVIKSQPRRFKEISKTFHDIDHPIAFKEGAYLKSIYWQAE